MKRVVFISHANNLADNEAAQWLGLQLVRAGYDVWLDIIELKVGESHWSEIEQVIRNRAAKFIYILSDASNTTDPRYSGAAKELTLALSIRDRGRLDFVLPVLVSELTEDRTIHLSGINSTDFQRKGWAQGLVDVLDKLEADGVPRSDDAGPNAVADWWRGVHSAAAGVTDETESYLSNWFKVDALPDVIRVYPLTREEKERLDPDALPFPAHKTERHLITFADRDELVRARSKLGLSNQLAIEGMSDSKAVITSRFLKRGERGLGIAPRDAENALVRILRLAWERTLRERTLEEHEMAGGRRAYWFRNGFSERNRAYYGDPDAPRRPWRQLAGKIKENQWHFAISGWLWTHPFPLFIVRTHVLFSENGREIWPDKKRLQRTRVSACKTWWNDRWRDMLLASMRWVAGDEDHLSLHVAEDQVVLVSTAPVEFVSDVAYTMVTDEDDLEGDTETVDEEMEEALEAEDLA